MKRFYQALVLVFCLLVYSQVRASHAQGADLTYKFVGYDCLTGKMRYVVTATFYRDCSGIPAPTTMPLEVTNTACAGGRYDTTYTLPLINGLPCPYGGVSTAAGGCEVSQLCPLDLSQSSCHNGIYPGVQKYVYIDTVYLPGPSDSLYNCPKWYFSISVNARNNSTNLQNASSDNLYVEALVNNSTSADTATVTMPFSNVSPVIGFPALGTYGYVWTSGTCNTKDTTYITVVRPNAGADQTICLNDSIHMAATGTGTWSLISGPTTPTIVSTTSPHTLVRGFSVAGSYRFRWTATACNVSDTVVIQVAGRPNAGIDQTICQYNTTTMTGSGVGTWSALSTNPSATTITNPAALNTTITGFTQAGVYTFILTYAGCPASGSDSMNVTVTPKPNAGPDQTVCPGSTATMAATGTGSWTAIAGNPAATVITTNTSPTTTITGFSTAGTYKYIWSSNGCTDTAFVFTSARSSAGPDRVTCAGDTVKMAASGPGTWTALPGNPSPTVIDSATYDSTTISGFTLPGTYGYVWTSAGCTISDTANVIVGKAYAGTDQSTCEYSTVTMNATGAGIWTASIGNAAVAVINNPTSPNTTIGGFTAPGTYTFIWTATGCSATDSANVIITAKPNAGPDISVCQYTSASMAASGTGTWTALAGNPAAVTIATPSSPTTVIAAAGFQVAGTYGFIWSSGGCSDTALVVVNAKPNAGPDQGVFPGNSATMAATGTGTWSGLASNTAGAVITNPTSPTTTITGLSVCTKYGFIWTSNGCSDTMFVTTKPSAGPRQTVAQGDSVALTSTGSGAWSALSGNPSILTHISNNSVTFGYDPVPFVCEGYPVLYNNGASEIDGDSIVYSLITPLSAHNAPLIFTSGFSVNHPVSTAAGQFQFNPATGQLNFTPSSIEVDVLALQVTEYRNGVIVGSTIRDVQVKILQCTVPLATQYPPSNLGNANLLDTVSVQLCPNTPASWDIKMRDSNGDSIVVKSNLATFGASPLPGATMTQVDSSRSVVYAHINWTPQLSDTGCHYYTITTNTIDCPIEGNTTITYRACVFNKVQVSPHEAIYCGTPIQLAATGGTNATWSPPGGLSYPTTDSLRPLAAPSATTLYTFTSACGSDTSLIIYNPPFSLSAGPGGTICQNNFLQLNATIDSLYAPYQIRWIPAAGLTNPVNHIPDDSILNPIASPQQTTTYTFQAIANTGCVRTDTVQVRVNGQSPAINAHASPDTVCPGQQVQLWVTDNPVCGLATTPCAGPAHIIQVGTGTTTQGGTAFAYPAPYGNYYKSARHEFLFQASELRSLLGSGGTIESVAMDVGVLNSGSILNNFTIRIGCVPNDSLTSYVNDALLSTVFVGNYTPVAGWNTHTLQNPYNWDGQSNLVIDMCFNDVTNLNINPKMIYTTTPFSSVWYTYTNAPSGACGYTGAPPATSTANYQRPNFKFNMCVPPLNPVIWTPSTGPNGVTVPNTDTTSANPVNQTTYYVTLADTNGCSSRDFVTVYVDTAVQFSVTPADTFICSSTAVQLHARVTASVGSGFNPNNIIYTWSTRPSTAIAPPSGTGPGFANPTVTPTGSTTYICAISGPNICVITDSTVVTLGTGLPVNKTVDSISCANSSNGRIVINMNAGTPPYHYTWSPAASNIDSIMNLGAGTYYLTVTDTAGCIGHDTTRLIPPSPLTVTFDSTNLLCFNVNTGSITAHAAGGRPPYRYTWSPPAGNTNSLTALAAGTYQLTVTDTSGCTATGQVSITQPAQLTSSTITTSLSGANTHDGTITVITSGGTPAYSYTSSPSITGLPTATGLDTGTYYITVRDANGCIVYDTAHVSGPPPINIYFTVVNNLCHDSCHGTASASAAGGVAPYTYNWTVTPTGPSLGTGTSITNLCAGTYRVTVMDSNHISVFKDTVISAPTAISMHIDSVNISCFGANDGRLHDSVWGGVGPYSIIWTPGGPDPLTGLGAGSYSVQVYDANQCLVTGSATISEPAPVTATIISTDSVSCFGGTNGIANVLVTGGTRPYQYIWSGSNSVDSFAGNLSAGPQTVNIIDANGCTANTSFTIYQPTQLVITSVDTTPSHCATSHDGSATAHVSGGSPGYTYTWDGTVGSATITGLIPGNHNLIVTDSKGCIQPAPFVINTIYTLALTMGADSVTCYGGSDGLAYTTVLNGTPGYTYSWSPSSSTSDSATGLSASTQTVIATDLYGCTATGTVVVAQPDSITDQAYFVNPLCASQQNGKVWITASGTMGPYTFSFNGSGSHPITDTIFNLGAQTYTFVVSDSKGCTKAGSVTLSDPSQLVLHTPVASAISCANDANGTIQVSPTGGTQPYTYTWTPGGYTTALIDSLGPGTYNIKVTDANGCFVDTTVTLTAPPPISLIYLEADSTSCPDSSDGHIVVDPTGGTPFDVINPYHYSIDGVHYFTDHNFYDLAAGTYTVYVMDSPGCIFQTTVTVHQPFPVTVSINPQDSVIALGSSIQLSTTIANNSTQSINSYTWSPINGLNCLDCPAPIASPFQTTTYYLTLNYGKNCITTASDKIQVGPGADVYIPNAFTPNGDGVNDEFSAFGTTLQSVGMKIFNRWGEKVFDSGDSQWASWDGTYKGASQPTGVYVYYVELVYLDGKKKFKQGSVTLIR